MRNLVIDIGNTNSKIGIFERDTLIVSHSMKYVSSEAVMELINNHSIDNSTISSVGGEHNELVAVLKQNSNFIPFSSSVNTGIANYYGTPSTMGLDRWAKIIAAHRCYTGRTTFIIDAGTCITYDLLTSTSEYYGGSISLGLNMRFEALHHFTQRLPLVNWDRTEIEIPQGRDTHSAIKSGVLQGAVNEIEGFIALANKQNKDLTVLVTGGDASFLLVQLKNSIFAPQIVHDPYLVLKGLNEVIAFEYVQKS